MIERARYVIAAVALIGFVLSLAVHVAAYAGIDVETAVPAVWLLHAGVFAVFLPFVLSSRKVIGRRAPRGAWREVMPTWVMVVGALLLAYVVVNFFTAMRMLAGGSPALVDGQYVLQNHGRFVSTLTLPEYTAARALVVRMFSGHWLFFYFAPFAYFAFARSLTPRADGDGGR
ncbi:MAG: hypothetical protein ABJD97_21935 [Betaproteobacteria bacterium]